jgi:hypothetical protein
MSATDDLIKQILASSNTSKWTGEGFGSAEKNAADMAKILNEIGITDIKQFGKVPEYQRAEVQYGVNGQVARQDEDGNYYIMASGGTDSEGNQINYRQSVDPKDLQKIYGYYSNDGEISRFVPADQSKVNVKDGVPLIQVGENFGNKLTGQTVKNTYGERQTGDFFGGTYTGKGNTAYGVQLDAQGNPMFYTQGASSNDVAKIMQDLGPVGQMAAAYFGGPMAVAAISAASGKPIGDIIKSAALSYLGGQAGELVSGTSGLTDVLGKAGTDALAGAAKQYVASGGKTDIEQLLLGAGLNYGANALGDQIGLNNLTDTQKKMLNTALSGAAGKQSLEQILMNVAMTGAMNQKRSPADQMTVTPDPANLEDFLASIDQYKVDQNADASGQGYYDEITGKFIRDDLGGLLNPLDDSTGNLDPNKKWEYNLVRPGVWADDQGNEIDLTYLPNSETALTGEEIMRRAGAMPGGGGTKIKVPTPKGSTPSGASQDTSLAAMIAAMNGQQQTMQVPSQDPFAHIKLMEDLFGTSVDLTPTVSLDGGSSQKSSRSEQDDENTSEDAE